MEIERILIYSGSITLIVILIVILIKDQKKRKVQKTEEEAEFLAKVKSVEHETQRLADTFKEENLPELDSDIKLKRGEKLHGIMNYIQWCETRKVRTGTIGGHGITARIKIAKGIYYRAGVGLIGAQTEDRLQVIDDGILYITSSRLLFRGSTSNKTLQYSSILSFESSIDGITIEKDKGKDIYIPHDFLESDNTNFVLMKAAHARA